MGGSAFSHVNILSEDPRRLVDFYVEVFDCEISGPPRHLEGGWLERGMGLEGAVVDGFHLGLPGTGDPAATLEIYRLPEIDARAAPPAATAPGLMHLAFTVEDIGAAMERLLAAGGSAIGEIAEAHVEGVGSADFVYARDPDGNIVELQAWK